MTILFLKGLVFGFLLAASVGPMWVLCFRRTIEQGTLTGFVSGLGVAVADALYGAVAAFGLTAISGFLLDQSFWLGLAGGVVPRHQRRRGPDHSRLRRVATHGGFGVNCTTG